MSIVFDDTDNRYHHWCWDHEPGQSDGGDDPGEENNYWIDGEGWYLSDTVSGCVPCKVRYCFACGEELVSSPQTMYEWDEDGVTEIADRPIGMSAAFHFTKPQSDLFFALQRKMRQTESNLSWNEFGVRMLEALAKQEKMEKTPIETP